MTKHLCRRFSDHTRFSPTESNFGARTKLPFKQRHPPCPNQQLATSDRDSDKF